MKYKYRIVKEKVVDDFLGTSQKEIRGYLKLKGGEK